MPPADTPRDDPSPVPGPLAGTLARLPADRGVLVLGTVPAGEPGWLGCLELHGTPQLDALVRRVHGNVAALATPGRAGDVPAGVAPSYVLEWYLRAVASAAAQPFVTERRVPRLEPGTTAVRLTRDGWPDAVALGSPGFACLRSDPDAGHRDAEPVAGPAVLRAALRQEVAAHARAFLARWGRRGRRGRRAGWAVATDALVEALQRAAPGDHGVREAQAVLPAVGGVAPFVGPARFEDPGPGEGDGPFHRRFSCCLAYTVPGAQACRSCPRLGVPARPVARAAAATASGYLRDATPPTGRTR